MLTSTPRWETEGRDWPNRECSRFVRAGGLRWHVQVAGSGPTVLLLHGTGGATHSWAGLLPSLARSVEVVAPDLPGHGFTEEPPGDEYSSARLRSLVEALLEELGRRPSLLVGHSAGGAVAVRLARRVERVRGVVGLAPSLAPPPGAVSPWTSGALVRRMAASAAAASAAALLARSPLLGRTLASTGTELPSEQIARYRRLASTRRHSGAALSMMAHWDPDGVRADLQSLSVPALMLAGQEDEWIPPGAMRAAVRSAPAARVEEVPGAGHLFHEVSPAPIAARILDFAGDIGVLEPPEGPDAAGR